MYNACTAGIFLLRIYLCSLRLSYFPALVPTLFAQTGRKSAKKFLFFCIFSLHARNFPPSSAKIRKSAHRNAKTGKPRRGVFRQIFFGFPLFSLLIYQHPYGIMKDTQKAECRQYPRRFAKAACRLRYIIAVPRISHRPFAKRTVKQKSTERHSKGGYPKNKMNKTTPIENISFFIPSYPCASD